MLRKKKPKRDSGTRSAVTKGPLRDPEHLARVRTLKCCECHTPPPTQAHHIRECFPRTMGVRVGDDRVIPLCQACHAELHANSRTFWDDRHRAVRDHAQVLYRTTLSLRGEANPESGALSVEGVGRGMSGALDAAHPDERERMAR